MAGRSWAAAALVLSTVALAGPGSPRSSGSGCTQPTTKIAEEEQRAITNKINFGFKVLSGGASNETASSASNFVLEPSRQSIELDWTRYQLCELRRSVSTDVYCVLEHMLLLGETRDEAYLRCERALASSPVAAVPLTAAPAAPLPVPDARDSKGLGLGIELGLPSALRAEWGFGGRAVDAAGLRVSANIGVGYSA